MKKIIFCLILLSASSALAGDDPHNGEPGKLYDMNGEEIANYNAFGMLTSSRSDLFELLEDAEQDDDGDWHDEQGRLVATRVWPLPTAVTAESPFALPSSTGFRSCIHGVYPNLLSKIIEKAIMTKFSALEMEIS